jgi:CO/xanthine dehydrogenase Mo-binding subunit
MARQAFAHQAVVTLAPGADADDAAAGAAITVALCGSFDHQPRCPLAPHHTARWRDGAALTLRTLFAVAPELEAEVRARIDAALARGEWCAPDAEPVRWLLRSSGPSTVGEAERAHADRLIGN